MANPGSPGKMAIKTECGLKVPLNTNQPTIMVIHNCREYCKAK